MPVDKIQHRSGGVWVIPCQINECFARTASNIISLKIMTMCVLIDILWLTNLTICSAILPKIKMTVDGRYPLCSSVFMLKPRVGEIVSMSSPLYFFSIVVLPALSNPLGHRN